MAFSVTAAASMGDVLDQVVAFAVANAGFTNGGNYTISTQTYRRLTKGGITWHFVPVGAIGASANNILGRMSYSSAAAWPTTANGAEFESICTFNAFAGPYINLFMFTDGTNVHVCVEMTNNIFTHMSFGKMTVTDSSIGGGEYFVGNHFHFKNPTLYGDWRSPTNGNSPPWMYNTVAQTSMYGGNRCDYTRFYKLSAGPLNDYRDFSAHGVYRNSIQTEPQGPNGHNDELILRSPPNSGTGRSILLPIWIDQYDPAVGLLRTTGYIPNIRVLNMNNLNPKEIILTNWQVFPIAQQDGDSVNVPNTFDYAFAYQRV